jgi:threonine dehydrogenase-like Zn-dependent dehydrogenase
MKKAVISGLRKAGLVEVPDPKPKGDWVLVKVHAAPMCAEYKSFATGKEMEFVGHEAAGEVVAVAQPGKVKAGDRVVAMPLHGCGNCSLCKAGDYIHCQDKVDFTEYHGSPDGYRAMAQYILKPSWLLMPIPEGVSYEKASLACCGLGPSFGAFQAMNLGASDTLLITGAGPVGLGGIVNARFRGARVIVAESQPWRVKRAQEMGAAAVVDFRSPDALQQILELTGGRGVDCALECAGTISAQRLCIEAARRKGKAAFVGECTDDLPIRVGPDLLRTGLTLIGIWHYNLNDYPEVMQVIQESPLDTQGKPPIDLLISHVLPMGRIQEAFELQASGDTAKVILKPWE